MRLTDFQTKIDEEGILSDYKTNVQTIEQAAEAYQKLKPFLGKSLLVNQDEDLSYVVYDRYSFPNLVGS